MIFSDAELHAAACPFRTAARNERAPRAIH
jgi:hypothetical protein